MSDSLDRDLTVVERLALRGHFLACKTCPPALRQMRLVRSATRSLTPIPSDAPVQREDVPHREKLSESARQRIKQTLRESESNKNAL